MIYPFSKRPDPGGFSDEELQIAARAVQDAMLQSLEEESESKHIFSESFLARMNALFLKDERRNGIKRALQHAAIIVIGVFLTGALLLAFNPTARADFSRWIRNTYEKSFFYDFFSRKDGLDESPNETFPEIKFTWLPSEYSIQELFSAENKRTLYLFNDNSSIILNYWEENEFDHLEIFSSDFIHEEITINGLEADYYSSLRDDVDNMLVWTSDDYRIIFNMFSHLSKEDMTKIAEGIIIY